MTLWKGGGGKGGGVETKRHMTVFRRQIELQVAPYRSLENKFRSFNFNSFH